MIRGRHFSAGLAGATVVFVLNTAFIAATASASLFYFANVVLHMGFGVVLAVVFGRSLSARWRAAGALVRVASVLCAAGVVTGVAIMIVGAAGPFRKLLPVHIGLSLAGGVPLLLYALHGAATRLSPLIRQPRAAFATVCAVLVLTLAASVAG